MAKLNLVQQGGELAYLLLHDPEFRSRVRREHLYEAGKLVRLKPNIDALYSFLSNDVEGFHFDFYVISAGPVEIIRSALEGIIPADHIFGTEFEYNEDGEIERIKQVTAGYGKVAVIDQLLETLTHRARPHCVCRRWQLGHSRHAAHQPARRLHHCRLGEPVPGADRQAFGHERKCAGHPGPDPGRSCGLGPTSIREVVRRQKALLIQQWDKVQTDMLTIVPTAMPLEEARAATAD